MLEQTILSYKDDTILIMKTIDAAILGYSSMGWVTDFAFVTPFKTFEDARNVLESLDVVARIVVIRKNLIIKPLEYEYSENEFFQLLVFDKDRKADCTFIKAKRCAEFRQCFAAYAKTKIRMFILWNHFGFYTDKMDVPIDMKDTTVYLGEPVTRREWSQRRV